MEWKAAGYAYSAILLQSSILFFEMVIMLIAQLRLCFKNHYKENYVAIFNHTSWTVGLLFQYPNAHVERV